MKKKRKTAVRQSVHVEVLVTNPKPNDGPEVLDRIVKTMQGMGGRAEVVGASIFSPVRK